MASATATIVVVPLLARRRELLLGAALTAAFAALLLLLGPAPGDAPAHLYRTLLVRHGAFLWDNYWYEGNYPLASYSLLYYLPAALVGNLPLVFAASVVSTVLFSSLALGEWGSAALWPSRVFGVLAAAPLFTGLYAYSLGFTTMLGALKALQTRRVWLALLLALATVGFSPLAFAFLCLVLAAVFVERRKLSRRTVAMGVGLVLVAGVELLALLLFRSNQGVYPFHAIDFAGVLATCTLGSLLARRARAGATLVSFYALWGLGSVLLYVVPTPLGDNWTRLGAFSLPVMMLTASLAGFRPRRLVVLALAVAFAYNITPYLLLIPSRLDNRPATAAFWQPAIRYLDRNAAPGYRVEVVPTAAHWESYWIPRAGFPLARGWYRQLDTVDNAPLYTKHLDPAEYVRWLRRSAVEYVLLAHTQLDWDGGPEEARILRASPELRVVFRSRDWTIYRLQDPTPMLTGPGRVRVTRFGHTTIRAVVSRPGTYLLRAHYNPYWRLQGGGCVRKGPAKMTRLLLTRPGPFALSIADSPDQLLAALTARHSGRC